MRYLTIVLLSALIAMPLTAMASDPVTNVTWKSSLALGATYKDGNTEKSLYTGTLKADRYAPRSNWINSLYTEYGKTKNQTTGEKEQTEGQVRGQSDYRYKFGGKDFFAGVFGEAYYDDIKNIRTRLKLGPNTGYYFINKDTAKFDVSFGINYVYERTATYEEDFGEYRAAANYSRDITEKSSYYLNAEYSARMDDLNDGNGLLVTGLKSSLKDNLSMFVELRDEYDNMPDPGIEHNDLTLIAGLAYDF